MKIYNLKCKILTPIHIGDGTELQPYEYVIKDKKFYKFLFNDFIMNLSSDKQREILHLMETDIIKLHQFLKNNFIPSRHSWEYSVDVSEEIEYNYETKIANELNQLIVSPFIKTSNRPYIPGSSFKGALRTAVLACLVRPNFESCKPNEVEPKFLQYGYWDRNKNKFRKHMGNDPFRAIKITDSILLDNPTIIDEIITETQRGQIKTTREVTYSELTGKQVEFNVELRIDDKLLIKNKGIKQKLDISTIANACNNFYKNIVAFKEKNFFSNKPDIERIYERISCKSHKDSFLIRLGWGSGKNSISLNLKRKRPPYIKSRRLVAKKFPLGWVEVTYL